MRLHSAWFMLLLAILPLLWWYWRRRPRAAVLFSSIELPAGVRPGLWARLHVLLPILRTGTVAILIFTLARPQKGNEQTRIFSEGIAIQIVVDRSGSMRALDFKLEGRPVDRLQAVRKVVRDFVLGGEGLPGRVDDLVGLVAFARFADSRCPLTLDHDFLVETLNATEIVKNQEEDGTAIGDAIALGVERLRSLDERKAGGAGPVKSRVLILLTDGENNAGEIDPIKAADIASTFGIRIYTIGAGTQGVAPVPMINPFSGREIIREMRVSIDEELLRKIASQTGGRYFRATDTDSLTRIYAEIDKLERTKTEEKRYLQYSEFATEPVRLGGFRLPPLLLIAFVLLAAEVVLGSTRLRRAP